MNDVISSRTPAWVCSWRIFPLLLLLLAGNLPVAAQSFLLRYVNTTGGALTFSGNTLGLAKLTGANQPGALDAIGAFTTLNTNSQVGSYPPGTTLNWSNNSSAAVLRFPTNSTVLYAELIWAGSAQIGNSVTAAGNVLGNLNTPVKFILPDGSTNSVAPDPLTASLVTNGAAAIFYVRSAEVTTLIQTAGTGTYSLGGVPAAMLASEDANNACGWTLAVVYGNSSLHQRNLSLFVGNSFAIASGSPPNPAAVTGFCAPPSGPVNGRLFVSTLEGDPNKTGDQMKFGPTTNTLVALSGTNNLVNNFFAGQINGDNGLIDTSGTFGLSNSTTAAVVFSARQGWDITSVDVSSGLNNGLTSAYAQNVTAGDGYSVNALGLQIDVGSPVLATTQSVDKASTFVGDILTYTVTVTNSGTADAVNLLFTDLLPFGTSFIANTFATNGLIIAGASPVNGVPIPIIQQNSSFTFTYQVQVNQIPPSAKFVTAATINFQYSGACAQSPVINGTLVNGNVQTLVPLLNVSKASSLTNAIPGANLTYAINVPNIGTTNTVGTTLVDPIPTGLIYVTNTTTLNGVSIPDISGTNMPYTVITEIHGPGRPAGQINVGDTAVVTFQVKISPTPPARINNTATIYANGTNAMSAQSAAVNIVPVYSDLAVGIIGSPNPVSAGAPISYTVTVTNRGPDSINLITNFITLYLPLSSSILSPVYTPGSGSYNPLNGVWSGITLASNGVVTLNISGTVSPNAASTIVSSVTATPPPGIIDLVTNNNAAAATNSVVQVADLAVTISDGVTNVYRGGALTYVITAINLGPSTLNSITVSNSFSSFLTNLTFAPSEGNFNTANGVWSGLALAAGDSVTLTVQATVRTNVSGAFTNTSTASVPPGVTDPVLTNNNASDVDVVLLTPDVAVTGSGPANVLPGGTIVYTVTVTNLSPLTASNVVVSDSLPSGVVFVSATGGGTNNSGVVTWPTIVALTNGQGFTFFVTVTAPAGGTLTNIVSGVTSTVDPVPGNNNGADPSAITITTVTPVADLKIGKIGPATVFAGSNLTYTISVTNFGPSSAGGVVVTDALPVGVIFVSASGGGATNSGVVNWNLGTMTSGQVSNVTVTVTAPASGSLTNTANVSSPTGDPVPTNNVTPPVVTGVTPLADVSVSKTGPAGIIFGTNYNYTITVSNAGPSTATSLSVTDSLPVGLMFVSSVPVTTTNAGNQVIWNLGNLVAGTSSNLTLTVISTLRGSLTNVASGGSPTGDPVPTNNVTPPVVTVVTNFPPLANPDFYSMAENTTNTLSPLTNDVVRTPGGGLTIIAVNPTNGTASISGTNIIFTPAVNFIGTAFIGYTITDNVGGTNSSIITITVTNFPPLANPDFYSIGENSGTNTLSPLTNDLVRTPGGSLTIISVSPTNGTATISGTNVLFAPATNFLGAATIGYTIIDNVGGTNVGLITVTVTNLPPLANPDAYTVLENSTNTFSPLTNDVVRTPGGTLAIVSVSPTNGTAVISGTNIIFTPTNNFIGTATIGYIITDGIGGTNSSIITVTVLAVADVAVSKTGPATVFAATNFDYIITVTNLGPGPAASLSVTDSLPSAVSFVSASGGGTTNGGQVVWANLGSLAAGAATNLTVTVTAPVSGASLTNLASGGSPTSEPNPTNNTSPPVVTTVTPIANLALGKIGPATVFAASNLTYTISVTNFGPSSASSVVVTDALPAGVTFVSASGNGVTNAGVVNWNLGILANGQVSNLTVTVTAPASGSLTNTANVTSPTSDPVPTNNVTPPVITVVTPLADLQAGKIGPAAVFAASNLTYTISVTNFGPSSASSVVVTDALPVGVTFVSASGGGTTNSSAVNWNLGTLANGQVSNVTVTVTAPASGSLTNTANVSSPTGDPTPTNNVTPPVITSVTPVADVGLGKIGPASVFAASNLTYTISVTNFGPSSASSLVVTDALPVGVIFVSASGGGTTNAGVVNWNLGTLVNGQVSNVTVTVTAPASGSLTNTANVNSPTGDPTPTNNVTPPVVTTVTPLADVSVIKVGPAGIVFGTNYNYTITVSNAGPSTATSLSVTDSLPVGLAFVSSVPVTTTNASNQVIWSLGNFVAGTSSNLTVTVISTLRGSLTNTASGGSPTPDPVPTNNVTPPVVTLVTNYPPLANPDGYAMTENTTNTLSPLTNDVVRTPGGSLTIIAVNPTNGTANISGTNIIFTPTLNFIGIATIGYTITDNVGGTNSSLITIIVTNIPPLANPDVYSMAENTTNTFSPLTNDVVRTTGGNLSLVSVIGTNGTATINGTNVTFVPTLNFIGVATIGYTITDNIGGTNSSIITITVTNLPPLANPDFYSMAENTTNTFSPLTNDVVRTPGGSLTLISVSPTNGSAIISGTNVVFTPTLNFVGIATIGYTIIDNVGGTNSSLITVTVTNQSPLAFAQSVTTTENTALPITLTGSDPAGRPLTFIIVTPPTNGALTLLNTNTGTVTYTPNNNYTGADAFVFRVNNGINNSSNATIAITVTPVADLLVAQSGPLSGVAGANLTYTVAVTNLGPAGATNVIVTNQLAAGFTFVSASAAGVNSSGFVLWTIPVLPANGKTNLTVTVFAVEGGTFTNLASGISDTLDLNATNNNGTLTNAQVRTVVSALADVAVFKTGDMNVQAGGTVNYSITATNNGPSTAANVVVQDVLPANATLQGASGIYSVSNNLIVWAAVDLAGGTATTFNVSVTAPTSGALTNIASSTSTTPDSNTNNNDGTSSNSIVRTTVTPVADLAIGKSGPAGIFAGTIYSYTISVTNFGPSLATTFSVTDSLPAGVVFVSASPVTTTNVANQVIWTNLANLAAGATSNLTLTVRAIARGTVTNFASVGSPLLDNTPTNNVSAPVITAVTNRPPVAADDAGSTPKNVAVTIPVLANDSDPDGDALTIVSFSPTNGTAFVSGTNLVFTPTPAFIGTGFVLYTISDGFGGTNSALLMVTVTNRAPVANGQSVTTLFNTAKAVTLTGSDADSDALTFIIVNPPTNGVLSLLDTNTGAVTYTPNNNYVGADAFTFRVNDGTTNSAVATVSISVTTPVVADLAVFKTGPATGVAGSNLVYSITVTNLGPAAATNVLVKDQLPAGFTFVSATPTNVTVANNLVSWGAFNLAAHGKTNFTVTAFSAEGGTFTNLASATSDAFDTNAANNNGTSTNSQVRTIVTARADVAVFKDGGTNVIAGGIVNYTITATNLGPSTATNVVVKDNLPAGATFSSATAGYILSNNVVTWPAIVLTNGATASYSIALIAPAGGSFTNIALGTSDTPDPNLTNNNGSVPKARVTTQVVPYADVIVLVFGPTNAIKGSNFVYNIVVTNAGPSGASNVVTSDSLPTNLVFVSASSGGLNTNGVVTWPKVTFLPFGGVTNYSLVVNAPVVGVFTNVASAVATTFDPNPTNNTGVLPASQVLTTVSLAQLEWIAGLPVFNPQTGLYEESVTVTNTGSNTVAGLRLYVGGLPNGVSLWNATGTNGLPYVQYNFPLNPSNSVGFVLEFYDPTRMAFSNTLSVVAIIPPNNTNGLGTNGAVAITKIFTDVRTNGTRFVIEFNTVPGKTYTILYSADLFAPVWKVGTPSVTASANITQWYDDGPPKTESKPTSVNSRFYRLIQN